MWKVRLKINRVFRAQESAGVGGGEESTPMTKIKIFNISEKYVIHIYYMDADFSA